MLCVLIVARQSSPLCVVRVAGSLVILAPCSSVPCEALETKLICEYNTSFPLAMISMLEQKLNVMHGPMYCPGYCCAGPTDSFTRLPFY